VEDKIKVLFLGAGDAARCEMAEGFLRSLAGDRFIAVSAFTAQTPTEVQTRAQSPAASSASSEVQRPGQAEVNTTSKTVDPLTIEVMKELGIDISQQRTKYVAEVFKDHFAYVVGVCDMEKERCPVFPFTYELLQWDIEDPAAAQAPDRERIVTFRRVRDSIGEKIRDFIVSVSQKVAPKAAAAAGKAR
jgi:arsenate reductase